MSTFSGINLSSRALAAAQRNMDVTGQNIANANTQGYTRQRVEQVSTVAAQGTWARKDVAGTGVEVTGITRIADALLDATMRADTAASAEQQATARIWNQIEASLGEPSATGLSTQLAAMHSSWANLGRTEGTEAAATARADVLARSKAVVDTLATLDAHLASQWSAADRQLDVLVEQANSTAAQVAGLNEAILKANATGTSPNELIDHREQALSRLAELTGARVTTRENGMVDVHVGNAAIVTGISAEKLSVSRAALADIKHDGAVTSLRIGQTGVLPVSGSLRATVDAVNTTIPRAALDLDATARRIGASVNAVYNPGGTAALDFFAMPISGRDYARGMVVRPDVTTTNFTDRSDATTVDRDIARRIGNLVSAEGGPTATWRAHVTNVASKVQSAEVRAEVAGQTAMKSAAARDSVSGVSIDEEMTNLVAYQHAYNAAARVLTTIDQALDTLINRTGLVGR
ncbi:flagellar hook-associated protein 1 FlgK [Kineococcus xinjiangensis]|uniref:Flagellar hook-associated protein 1 n=1 Tax=Kineococcus xinjiangensis TaxID=512762 RepID=A0A2S6ID41_9ACTN|nr:flagellar hook-associated protein FlgK [Kineococcus xinjiangensis]PPK92142.1 flagellar hook-associated protein 1 FlgK [Kineococcus xinjiangensis]